jgi:hypothetical protein
MAFNIVQNVMFWQSFAIGQMLRGHGEMQSCNDEQCGQTENKPKAQFRASAAQRPKDAIYSRRFDLTGHLHRLRVFPTRAVLAHERTFLNMD